MKTRAVIIFLLAVGRAEAAALDADIARFITAKSNEVYAASRDQGTAVPPEVWKMFSVASTADWRATSNLFEGIVTNYHSAAPASGSRRLPAEIWYRVQDVGGLATLLSTNNFKFIRLFADEIFKVVPPGSVYFGGTDPGRFAITALSRSHEEGKPFFTLTQNALADSDYLKYARSIYHESVKLPDEAMFRQAFDDYVADATRRFQHDQQFPNEPKQIAPGEDIHQAANGGVQFSGTTAVMAINGLLARDILNANPGRDFYIEESYVLEWMYPYLEPAGPIFKLRHAPMETLFEETIRNDREYWQRLTRQLTGVEVHDETTLEQICASAQELSGQGRDSQGDADFLRTRRAFDLRQTALGHWGLYTWRATHAKSTSERRQMNREAELAWKQAYLLGPRNTEAVWRYVLFLVNERRIDEAQKLVAAAGKLNPDDNTIKQLAGYVEQCRQWLKNNP